MMAMRRVIKPKGSELRESEGRELTRGVGAYLLALADDDEDLLVKEVSRFI